MRFTNKLAEKNRNPLVHPVTAAFLGDSVTQGSFELYTTPGNNLGGIFDYKNVYHNRLKEDLALLFPEATLNVINAGIGGDNAVGGLARLDRDVLRFHPDLTVIAYGLNDATGGAAGIDDYKSALDKIFRETKKSGSDVIYMTENMMCTYVSPDIEKSSLADAAKKIVETQTGGMLDRYFEAAADVCADNDVILCDCYAIWKKFHLLGADITQLLANKLNHPVREMHAIFSNSLFNIIMN